MACCYIVPPQLLKAIAAASVNSAPIREAAASALAHRDQVTATRRERLSILSQPRGYNAAAAQQLFSRQSIVPDTLLRHLAESEEVDEETRTCARRDLEHIQQVHSRRVEVQQGGLQQTPEQGTFGIASASAKKPPADGKVYRGIYDAKHNQNESRLPGTLVRAEGQKPVSDKAVNESYDNFGNVLKFYKEKFQWNSIDNKGMQVIASCHFGKNYENACKFALPLRHFAPLHSPPLSLSLCLSSVAR
jgi:Zn-dependent metalloprotease